MILKRSVGHVYMEIFIYFDVLSLKDYSLMIAKTEPTKLGFSAQSIFKRK